MATNATTSPLFPDNWNDLYQLLDQPLDMDAFLQSDLFAAQRNRNMAKFITNMISGLISFIASTLLAIHILRSHDCLSTTYNRLIFGLSAADIISSFAIALSSTMAPKEMSYLVPFASGNIATCDVAGSFITFGLFVSTSYNCSVCLYYLAIISYNKQYDYIRRKLEPWFHGISILVPLVICATLFATNSYNGPTGGICFPEPHYPPHCIGYEAGDIPKGYSIPCWRGGAYDGNAKLRAIALLGVFFGMFIIAPTTILVTMTIMVRSVTKIEKRMANYGVRALRLRATLLAAALTTNTNSARGFAVKMMKLGKCLANHLFAIRCFPCRCVDDSCCYDPERPSPTTKSNQMHTQKRAVLHMAFGYAGAWLLVWTPSLVFFALVLVRTYVSHNVVIFTDIMLPLQGFCNFIVFMAPKVRTTRTMEMMRRRARRNSENDSRNQHLTWHQVFYKAYMSRGHEDSRNIRYNNYDTERRRRHKARIVEKMNETLRLIFEKMKSFTTASSMRTPSPELSMQGPTNV